MEWQHVDSILQLVANGTTLPHLNLPVQIGVKGVGKGKTLSWSPYVLRACPYITLSSRIQSSGYL